MTQGPKLTDETFFTRLLDDRLPAFAQPVQAARAGRFSLARAQFAAHVRRTLRRDRWFSIPYETPANYYIKPGESLREAVDRFCRLELMSCNIHHQFHGEVRWEENPTPGRFPEWTFQLNRHNEWSVLAEVYRWTGDEKYADCFARMLRSWLGACPRPRGPVECDRRYGARWNAPSGWQIPGPTRCTASSAAPQ